MGLETHLRATPEGVGLVWAVGALAQDGDGDRVPDDAPDHCPNVRGVASNYGCPADLEVVVAYGYRWWEYAEEEWSDWFIDYVMCPDGNLYVSEDGCPTYGTWGWFAVAYCGPGLVHEETVEMHDGAETHCGYVENPIAGDCFCNEDEVKAEVHTGSFCRPSCPPGQRWADGLAYGAIYAGGGTCATNSCVNTRRGGFTRLPARPSIRCFPDMHRDYVDNIAEPTACYLLVGAGTGVACALVGSLTLGIACSAASSVVSAATDFCPGYPWID